MDVLDCCTLCPRNCKVNRNQGQIGYCGATNHLKVARAALHFWEEPSISGTNGSGAVFFSHCSMKCIYCQNYEISSQAFGQEIRVEDLANIFLKLQQQKAHNINLVTPTHFVPLISEAIKKAKKQGLTIPIIYNSSGYEKKETIESLKGLIDIYLPDFKYFEDDLAIKYSSAPKYFTYALESLDAMIRQVGPPKFDQDGLLKKGVIVRHLLLPNHLDDSKKIIHKLYTTYHDKILFSIMNQYTPLTSQLQKFPELDQTVSNKEYEELVEYAMDLGIEHGYIQEGETQKESFIPPFNLEGIR